MSRSVQLKGGGQPPLPGGRLCRCRKPLLGRISRPPPVPRPSWPLAMCAPDALDSILADPKCAVLYTNRARARLALGLVDSAAADCHSCLALEPASMKAHYILAQAQLAMGDSDAAVRSTHAAHARCVASNDRSLGAVTDLVLSYKKKRWEDGERRRRREAQELEKELLNQRRDQMLAAEDEANTIRAESAEKSAMLRSLFDRARMQSEKRRQLPEWAIDDISFGVMIDPVITKTGKSYERASIMEHLSRHASDPLTREPLLASELRPNLALRQACDEFLEHNGWAVDW